MKSAPSTQHQLFEELHPNSYNVKTDAFEGPLDLLLHLIKKNEVEIYNIPIAAITRQYLEYIDLLKELNLDVAGDFLVMASTLIQIKSRMLLPVMPDEEPADEEEDPRAELVRRLLEYQKYKEASMMLAGREMMEREVFARKFPPPELALLQPDEGVPEVELFELIEAFRRVLSRSPAATIHEVGAEMHTVAECITDLLDALKGRESLAFEELFCDRLSREYVITLFLALLELCRLKMVKLAQPYSQASIRIMPAVPETTDNVPMETLP
ncbi:MAG: segregation/condensation protein A [Geobacteraceae bacterium]